MFIYFERERERARACALDSTGEWGEVQGEERESQASSVLPAQNLPLSLIPRTMTSGFEPKSRVGHTTH